MDPRIGWHPNELLSEAYSTWTNVWMIAQMNCTTSQNPASNNQPLLPINNTHSQTCNVNTKPDAAIRLINAHSHELTKNTGNNSSDESSSEESNQYKKLMMLLENSTNCTCSTTASAQNYNQIDPINHYQQHHNNQNISVTSQTILNGLKSRKFNKASTFGFNFPINQHILDDPMSTPWLFTNKLPEKPNDLLNSSSLHFLASQKQTDSQSSESNNSTLANKKHSSNEYNDLSTYSSYLISNTRNRSKTASSSSSSTSSACESRTSTSSLSLSSLPHEDDSIINSSGLTSNFDDELPESNFDFMSENKMHYYSEGLNSLHKEIVLFADYIAPTMEELYMRNEIIWRITKIIKEELPNAEVDIFGSYKTGLFLPTSDIDMVVFGEWKNGNFPLKLLKDALIRENISDSENIKVLDKASVPIIKILEVKTDTKVDISFNTSNGVKSAELIKKYLVEFPCLRPLVMVLKQFLIQRDFNEVWTGGIGSYSLILMIVSFLQLHPRIDARSMQTNLGVLLIEFFELYGRCFNYMKTAIRITNGGCYLPKDDIMKQFSNGHRTSILCIEDPLNPTNDIGKGSYGALKVKQAFEYAYFTLSHAVLPQNEFILSKQTNSSRTSILGRIIRMTKEVREYRHWVKEAFEKKVNVVFDLAKEIVDLNQKNSDLYNEAAIENNIELSKQGPLSNNSSKSSGSEKSEKKKRIVDEYQSNKENRFSEQVHHDIKMISNQLQNPKKNSHTKSLSGSNQNLASSSNQINNNNTQIYPEINQLPVKNLNYQNNQYPSIIWDQNQQHHPQIHQQQNQHMSNHAKHHHQHQFKNNHNNNSQHQHQNVYNMNQTLSYLNQQYQQSNQHQTRRKSNGSVKSFESLNNEHSNNKMGNNKKLKYNENQKGYQQREHGMRSNSSYGSNKNINMQYNNNKYNNGNKMNSNQNYNTYPKHSKYNNNNNNSGNNMSHQSSFNLQQTNYQMNNSQLPPVPPSGQQAYQRPMFYIDQEQNASNSTNPSSSQTQQNFGGQDENETKRLVNTVTYLNRAATHEGKGASYAQRKSSETVSEMDNETKNHTRHNTEPEISAPSVSTKSPSKQATSTTSSKKEIQKSPGKELLEKIFKVNLFSSLSSSNLPAAQTKTQQQADSVSTTSDKNNHIRNTKSELDLNQFKLNAELGSASDFSKNNSSNYKQDKIHHQLAQNCQNCKFSKIECKCKLLNSVKKSAQEFAVAVSNGSSQSHNSAAYEISKENVNRDLSQLLSEIKNSNHLSVMKTLAAAQNQQKNIESQQQNANSQASSNKSDKLEMNNSSRVNVLNT